MEFWFNPKMLLRLSVEIYENYQETILQFLI